MTSVEEPEVVVEHVQSFVHVRQRGFNPVGYRGCRRFSHERLGPGSFALEEGCPGLTSSRPPYLNRGEEVLHAIFGQGEDAFQMLRGDFVHAKQQLT